MKKGASLLEKKMASLLTSRKILFEREKKLPGLIHKTDLRCDFYIPPGTISTLGAIIEVDGPHHFRNGHERANTFLPFDPETVVRDRIKNRYAVVHGYHMMRADFTIYKFYEKVLDDFLNQVKESNSSGKRIHNLYGELYTAQEHVQNSY